MQRHKHNTSTAPAHHPHGDSTAVISGDLSAHSKRLLAIPSERSDTFLIRQLNTHGQQIDLPQTEAIRAHIYCFFYIIQGEALIKIGDELTLFKANECVIIPEGQFFSVRYYNDCIGFLGGFHPDFLISDTTGNNPLRSFLFLNRWSGHNKVQFDAEHAPYIETIFKRLYTESQNNSNKPILKTYLTTLLVEINNVYNPNNFQPTKQDASSITCEHFIKLVFDNPNAAISIAEYADKLHLSTVYLQKTVKRITNKTPLAWINEAVILEAKTLLSHTDLSVGEIAERVGILDASYFSRLFKKQTGISPIAFKNKQNNP